MSFRKRSVKPNLGLSKRTSSPQVKTKQQEQKDGAAESEEKGKSKDIGLENIKSENQQTPPSKKLSKRAKVTPKLTSRSRIAENKNTEQHTATEKKTTEDTNNLSQTILSESERSKNSGCSVTDSCHKTEELHSAVESVSPKKLKDIIKKEVDITGHVSNSSKTPLSGNKLSKRCKITPKLSTRSERGRGKIESSNIEKGNALGKNEDEVTCLKHMPEQCNKHEEEEQEELQNKVVTILTSNCTNVSAKQMVCDAPNIITDRVGDKHRSKETETPSIINSISEDAKLSEEHILVQRHVDTEPLLKKVRFNEKHDLKQNNLELLSDICLAESGGSAIHNVLNKEDFQTENPNIRDDLHNQSSQSESEMMSTKLNFSKKNSFKPNLGGRRRKRLSSFSAYSSCDEEGDDTATKRRKKRNHKTDKQPGKTKERAQKKTKKMQEKGGVEDSEVVKKVTTEKRQTISSAERDLSTLTMQELIYYRPKSFKTVELRSKKNTVEEGSVIEIASELTPDESKPKMKVKKVDEEKDEEAVIAPQIMINEDGEIVINEESLTIKKKVDDSALRNSKVVYEDALTFGTHLRRKGNRGKRWKLDETLRFYKALSQIGTDFTLMSQAFGKFTRNELKRKFKQEEKVNCDLVDRALSNRLPLNMEMFLRGKEDMESLLDDESVITEQPDDGEFPENSCGTNECLKLHCQHFENQI